MARRNPHRVLFVAGLLALAGLGACDDMAEPLAPVGEDLVQSEAGRVEGLGREALKVMSWNTYLGGDTGPLFSLDLTDIPAVLAATQVFWAQVQENHTHERMASIVDEIEARQPHFVALQEVIQFAVIDMTTGQPVDGVDILASIQAHLASRGLSYEVVAVQNNTSSALPLAIDFSTMQPSQVLAFTERVVLLRRGDVTVTDLDQGTYAAGIPLGPLTVKRGWIRATFQRNGRPIHLVTTHLETQAAAPVQAAQAQELMDGVLAGLEGTVILTGDLNSDAEASEGDPSWTPTYSMLTEAGFRDAWKQQPRQRDIGFTCCQDPDLRNPGSALDQRLDFVLVRSEGHRGQVRRIPGLVRMELLGEERKDKTPEHGLWPADHAGLSVAMRLTPSHN